MGGDSLAHTNLNGQRRQEASIQYEFHRFGSRQRRQRGSQSDRLAFLYLMFNPFLYKGSVMRCNYASHTNYYGRRRREPQTALNVKTALTGFLTITSLSSAVPHGGFKTGNPTNNKDAVKALNFPLLLQQKPVPPLASENSCQQRRSRARELVKFQCALQHSN